MLAMAVHGSGYSQGENMKLRLLSGGACDDVETCPAIRVDEETGRSFIVGDELDAATRAQLNIGPGETALGLSSELIVEAARKLVEMGVVKP